MGKFPLSPPLRGSIGHSNCIFLRTNLHNLFSLGISIALDTIGRPTDTLGDPEGQTKGETHGDPKGRLLGHLSQVVAPWINPRHTDGQPQGFINLGLPNGFGTQSGRPVDINAHDLVDLIQLMSIRWMVAPRWLVMDTQSGAQVAHRWPVGGALVLARVCAGGRPCVCARVSGGV